MENLKERLITAIQDYGTSDRSEMFDAEDMAEYLMEEIADRICKVMGNCI